MVRAKTIGTDILRGKDDEAAVEVQQAIFLTTLGVVGEVGTMATIDLDLQDVDIASLDEDVFNRDSRVDNVGLVGSTTGAASWASVIDRPIRSATPTFRAERS